MIDSIQPILTKVDPSEQENDIDLIRYDFA